MQFNKELDRDGIVLRACTVGLVDLFNDKLKFVNSRRSGEDKQDVDVPFYYSLSGDERFLQDIIRNDSVTDPDNKFLEANTLEVPAGYLRLNGLKSVRSDALDNRYVRGIFTKKDDEGQLKTFSAELWSIPVSINYDCEIVCSSVTEQMKIAERVITTFYKSNPFHFDVNRVRIPATARIDETLDGERPIDFNFEGSSQETNKISINFSIDVNTFIGYFDPETERFTGNRMQQGIASTIFTKLPQE